ncbi:hypothetical protein A2841_00980 [Candidatus Kaiserbacteria bacterium RIFCSPHIGHO2_01_FULL_48_10]|uniref:Pseudouridine synthase n=1 Tax=Candidatus Kaiserbacteria bacterium RIFCSPHIGHO2_01_FULL_48_10 TaxID=1798476 RepID=A0A1F6C5A7_9BACT|nr:MAG: hypothetical protein A2841_00980 [Candidatus Kaiserbacteria bacterium RIFCSPHIGHO2_01_FULL_48_10]
MLFEDEDVLVVNKPAGLIVHSDGRTAEPTLAEWVLAQYPEMKDVGEPWVSPQGEVITRPGIVHRLDRTTSGVMVLAKNPQAFSYLKEQFQKRTVRKEYYAYVYGHPKDDHGVIEAEIGRTRSDPPRWSAQFGKKGNLRAAITEWNVIKRGIDTVTGEKISLLSVMPKTGRTHQIRVHLKAIHHPIVADALYAPNQKPALGFSRVALHARFLALTVPSGVTQTFEAPLPEDFLNAHQQFA